MLLLGTAGCRIADDPGAGTSVARPPSSTPPTLPPKPDAGTKPPAPPPAAPPPEDASAPHSASPMPAAANDAGASAGPKDTAPVSMAPPPDAGMPPVAMPPAPRPGVWWKPRVGMTWDWQLKVPVDQSVEVEVYDVDLFENTAETIAALKAKGRKVICYVNLGAWENWRPDADQFPKSLLGAQYHGFPDENWLDIRQITQLAPMVRGRLEMAFRKGCDAVEPDNMDGYNLKAHEPSGFPLTYYDQLLYNRFVAAEAHSRGLGVGLKNDVEQAADLSSDFDFHVSEQCFEFQECHLLESFIAKGKPVFEAEYVLPLASFCPEAVQRRISAIRKRNDLDAYREACQ